MQELSNLIFQIPYLLIFLPLLFSIICHFINDKKFLFIISIVGISSLTGFSCLLYSQLNIYNSYYSTTDLVSNIIGSEFRIVSVNLIYLINIFIIILINLINYDFDREDCSLNNIKRRKLFFSIYFLQIFAIVGILTSYNVFHIFLFIEIFSCVIFNLSNSYEGKSMNQAVYKFFSNSIFGSIIFIIGLFYLILYFNTSNIFLIKQQIQTINLKQNIHIFFIIFLILIGIVSKFLMLNVRETDQKKRILNNLSIENLFISVVLGLYLIDYFLFFLFRIKLFFNMRILSMFLQIVIGLNILQHSFTILLKTKNIYDIFINGIIIDICLILLSFFVQEKDYHFKLVTSNIIEYMITNIPLYFISVYFSEIYDSNELELINSQKLLKFFLFFIMLYKTIFPFSTGFMSFKYFIKLYLKNKNYLIITILVINKINYLIFLGKLILLKNTQEIREGKEMTKKLTIFKNTLYFLFLFMVMICVFNLCYLDNIV